MTSKTVNTRAALRQTFLTYTTAAGRYKDYISSYSRLKGFLLAEAVQSAAATARGGAYMTVGRYNPHQDLPYNLKIESEI